MDKLCHFSLYSALWFRIFCFLLHVYLTVSNKLKDKITLKEEHSICSCSLWLMCVYIHKHNTGLMLGKEIWSTVVNYVDFIGILGFFFFRWILLGIIGLNLNSDCMFFGLSHISWLLLLLCHVGEEGGEKCHLVVGSNKNPPFIVLVVLHSI